MIPNWETIKDKIAISATDNQVLPFLGAAISYFQPTNLPLGSGLLHSALQEAFFQSRNLFVADRSQWTPDELAIDNHSPEVILQGLAESLLDRGKLASIYYAMAGIPYNPLHQILANALVNRKVPAIFTTEFEFPLWKMPWVGNVRSYMTSKILSLG